MRRIVVLVLATVLGASRAHAQWPPERMKNVKELPATLPIRALIDTMAGFTRALGVRCAYCHVGGETTPFDSLDFSSDSVPAKVKAREMLRLVASINRELAALPNRAQPPITVSCATCHRGIAQPRPLQQVLLSAYDAGGADSVDRAYRALRQRYYGAASYDFGEVPLADVAAALRARDRLADAVRLYKMNIEFSPQSGFARRQAANAQLAAGDTAGAIANLERALELNANDTQAKQALERVRRRTP